MPEGPPFEKNTPQSKTERARERLDSLYMIAEGIAEEISTKEGKEAVTAETISDELNSESTIVTPKDMKRIMRHLYNKNMSNTSLVDIQKSPEANPLTFEQMAASGLYNALKKLVEKNQPDDLSAFIARNIKQLQPNLDDNAIGETTLVFTSAYEQDISETFTASDLVSEATEEKVRELFKQGEPVTATRFMEKINAPKNIHGGHKKLKRHLESVGYLQKQDGGKKTLIPNDIDTTNDPVAKAREATARSTAKAQEASRTATEKAATLSESVKNTDKSLEELSPMFLDFLKTHRDRTIDVTTLEEEFGITQTQSAELVDHFENEGYLETTPGNRTDRTLVLEKLHPEKYPIHNPEEKEEGAHAPEKTESEKESEHATEPVTVPQKSATPENVRNQTETPDETKERIATDMYARYSGTETDVFEEIQKQVAAELGENITYSNAVDLQTAVIEKRKVELTKDAPVAALPAAEPAPTTPDNAPTKISNQKPITPPEPPKPLSPEELLKIKEETLRQTRLDLNASTQTFYDEIDRGNIQSMEGSLVQLSNLLARNELLKEKQTGADEKDTDRAIDMFKKAIALAETLRDEISQDQPRDFKTIYSNPQLNRTEIALKNHYQQLITKETAELSSNPFDGIATFDELKNKMFIIESTEADAEIKSHPGEGQVDIIRQKYADIQTAINTVRDEMDVSANNIDTEKIQNALAALNAFSPDLHNAVLQISTAERKKYLDSQGAGTKELWDNAKNAESKLVKNISTIKSLTKIGDELSALVDLHKTLDARLPLSKVPSLLEEWEKPENVQGRISKLESLISLTQTLQTERDAADRPAFISLHPTFDEQNPIEVAIQKMYEQSVFATTESQTFNELSAGLKTFKKHELQQIPGNDPATKQSTKDSYKMYAEGIEKLQALSKTDIPEGDTSRDLSVEAQAIISQTIDHAGQTELGITLQRLFNHERDQHLHPDAHNEKDALHKAREKYIELRNEQLQSFDMKTKSKESWSIGKESMKRQLIHVRRRLGLSDEKLLEKHSTTEQSAELKEAKKAYRKAQIARGQHLMKEERVRLTESIPLEFPGEKKKKHSERLKQQLAAFKTETVFKEVILAENDIFKTATETPGKFSKGAQKIFDMYKKLDTKSKGVLGATVVGSAILGGVAARGPLGTLLGVLAGGLAGKGTAMTLDGLIPNVSRKFNRKEKTIAKKLRLDAKSIESASMELGKMFEQKKNSTRMRLLGKGIIVAAAATAAGNVTRFEESGVLNYFYQNFINGDGRALFNRS